MPLHQRSDQIGCDEAALFRPHEHQMPFVQRLIPRVRPPNHAGAEIFLDPLDRRRRSHLQKGGSELHAMRVVIHPRPARVWTNSLATAA